MWPSLSVPAGGIRVEAFARAEDDCNDQGGYPSGGVYHDAAREIDSSTVIAKRAEPATAPNPVADWVVDENAPQDDERDEGAEFHTLRERPSDQQRCNSGKHHLEGCEDCERNPSRVDVFPFVALGFNVDEENVVQVSDDPAGVRTQGKGVADDVPAARYR